MNVNSRVNKVVYEWHDFLETIREARRRCDDLEGQWAAMTDQARHTPYARALGQELAKMRADVLMREKFIEIVTMSGANALRVNLNPNRD